MADCNNCQFERRLSKDTVEDNPKLKRKKMTTLTVSDASKIKAREIFMTTNHNIR